MQVDEGTLQGRTAAAVAGFRVAVELTPDLKRGDSLFATCAACHGSDGRGNQHCVIPAIASQHVPVLVKQLTHPR